MTNLRALASAGSSLAGLGFVLAIQSFTGCSASPPPSNFACTSDTDCGGDSTCVEGLCITESGSSSSSGGSGGGSGSSSSGTVVVTPGCYQTCATAAECANGSNAPISGPDNWACNNGFCGYLGCNSTQECIDTYMNDQYLCTNIGISTFNSCYQKCASAVDCASNLAPVLVNSDNWACTGGLCEYKGCNTTEECTDTYMNSNYECAAPAGSTLKTCVHKCTVPADCPEGNMAPLSDADNYECNAGLCAYKGCNSTQECTDTFMKPEYVCK
jgi:hypothetical protein